MSREMFKYKEDMNMSDTKRAVLMAQICDMVDAIRTAAFVPSGVTLNEDAYNVLVGKNHTILTELFGLPIDRGNFQSTAPAIKIEVVFKHGNKINGVEEGCER